MEGIIRGKIEFYCLKIGSQGKEKGNLRNQGCYDTTFENQYMFCPQKGKQGLPTWKYKNTLSGYGWINNVALDF